MMLANYRVRRATLDDISQLTSLWQTMHFPAEDLSRRITEFQVAENPEGKLVGAVGLQIVQRNGRIHSEGFTDFTVADQLRPLLWERLHAVANNHGLLRLWTREQAPFWSHCGLSKADAEALEKMPMIWRDGSSNWLTLKLREDLETAISLDKEFALFMESEKQRTQRTFQHAKFLKMIATVIAFILFTLICGGLFYVVRKNPHFLPGPR